MSLRSSYPFLWFSCILPAIIQTTLTTPVSRLIAKRHRHQPSGMALPTAWVQLNRLAPLPDIPAPVCTNGTCPSAARAWRRTKRWPCCPALFYLSSSLWVPGLAVLDDVTIAWLLNTCPEIKCRLAVDWKNCSYDEEPVLFCPLPLTSQKIFGGKTKG